MVEKKLEKTLIDGRKRLKWYKNADKRQLNA